MVETVVDYDELVAAYADNLENVLRSFKPGPEFLDLWVHDEDDARSILNIAEAAEGYGLENLTIELSGAALARIDTDALLEMLRKVCEVELTAAGAGAKVVLRYG